MLRTRVLLLAALSATLLAQEKKEEKKEEKRPAPAAHHADAPPSRPAESRPAEARPAPQARPAEAAPVNRQPVQTSTPQPSMRQNNDSVSRPNALPSNRPATPIERNAPFGRAAAPAPAISPNAGRVVRNPSGAEVHYGPRGEVREVRRGDMVIAHGPNGMRRVEVARPDGRVIVASGFGRGYVQRPYSFHNQAFVQRTYYVGGVGYARVYRPYVFRGISINVYVPGRYYAPAFYGYAYNPWARPVVFSWGWGGSPWYGYYGGYFTPYPVYNSPSMWLTDYIISQQLQASYQQQMAANAQMAANGPYGGGQPGLTPEVKQLISDEVRQQLALENTERQAGPDALPDPASSGIARMLTDGNAHVFVVSAPLNVPTSDGGECAVTDGDVLQLAGQTAPNAVSANLVVLAGKGQDCRKGSQVAVNLADLQDMQNQMRATLDQGLGELQAKQGTGGLPPAPPAAAAAPVQTQFAALAPPPDPNGASDVNSQWKQASQADDQGAQGAQQSAPPPGQGGPVRISLGQTMDDVSAALGNPMNIVDLGAKKIYVYPNMKITFMDGKVSDVQ